MKLWGGEFISFVAASRRAEGFVLTKEGFENAIFKEVGDRRRGRTCRRLHCRRSAGGSRQGGALEHRRGDERRSGEDTRFVEAAAGRAGAPEGHGYVGLRQYRHGATLHVGRRRCGGFSRHP